MPAVLHLAPTPASVAEARAWSRQVASTVADAEVIEVLALLVSELVSNVVLHARTECSLGIVHRGDRLRVEVRDLDDRLPACPEEFDLLASSGRGLLMVQRLSLAHGVEPEPGGGKQVWCEVALAGTRQSTMASALSDRA